MSLTRIEYGSLASSSVINNNFEYLENKIENIAEGMDDNVSAFSSQVETFKNSVESLLDYKDSFISTGMIIPSLIGTIPNGYLICDGSELNVSDFPELYDVIGTIFGSSDSTKFNLPNLKSKTLWGSGDGYDFASYIESGLPNIKGQFRLKGTEGSSSVSGAFRAGSGGGSYGQGHNPSATNPLMTFDASRYNSIYSDGCSIVQPPALVVNFIIKY